MDNPERRKFITDAVATMTVGSASWLVQSAASAAARVDEPKENLKAVAGEGINSSTALLSMGATAHAGGHEGVSVFDFMTAAQVEDVRAGIASLDATGAIQAAINSLTGGGVIHVPQGSYKITGKISVHRNNLILKGVGSGRYGAAISENFANSGLSASNDTKFLCGTATVSTLFEVYGWGNEISGIVFDGQANSRVNRCIQLLSTFPSTDTSAYNKITSCDIHGFAGRAFNAVETRAWFTEIADCDFQAPNGCAVWCDFNIEGTAVNTTFSMKKCVIRYAELGIRFNQNTLQGHVQDCLFVANRIHALNLGGGLSFDNCQFENHGYSLSGVHGYTSTIFQYGFYPHAKEYISGPFTIWGGQTNFNDCFLLYSNVAIENKYLLNILNANSTYWNASQIDIRGCTFLYGDAEVLVGQNEAGVTGYGKGVITVDSCKGLSAYSLRQCDFGRTAIGSSVTPLLTYKYPVEVRHGKFTIHAPVSDQEVNWGTWQVGDRIVDADNRLGRYICTSAGYNETLSATTARTTINSNMVVLTPPPLLPIGAYITIAGVMGVKRLIKMKGVPGTYYMDTKADATVTSAVVSTIQAKFVVDAAIPYKSSVASIDPSGNANIVPAYDIPQFSAAEFNVYVNNRNNVTIGIWKVLVSKEKFFNGTSVGFVQPMGTPNANLVVSVVRIDNSTFRINIANDNKFTVAARANLVNQWGFM